MKYPFLINLALTYYGECPYGAEAYQDVNCSDTSTDESTSTDQTSAGTTPGSSNDSNMTNDPQETQANSGTGKKDTHTTTSTVGESPTWLGLTPTATIGVLSGIGLLVIGVSLFFILLKRRSRKNKVKLSS